nr:MAG TPA: hypothetical protein [Bacteriophage sp.]
MNLYNYYLLQWKKFVKKKLMILILMNVYSVNEY